MQKAEDLGGIQSKDPDSGIFLSLFFTESGISVTNDPSGGYGRADQLFATCDLDGVVDRYRNVVDCCVCGVRFLEVKTVGDSYRLSVEVKIRLTLDTGKKIRNRYEKIRLELEGRQDVVAQHSKALREYKCPNCGGSVWIS